MNKFILFFISIAFPSMLFSQEGDIIRIETQKTDLIYRVTPEKDLKLDYFGESLTNVSDVYNAGIETDITALPTYGVSHKKEKLNGVLALRTKHVDGNTSLDLKYVSHQTENISENISKTTIKLKDSYYPFYVNLIIKSFKDEDVLEMNTIVFHQEKKPVTLYDFKSGFLSFKAQDYWLSSFQGAWGNEAILEEEKLGRGIKIIQNQAGVRNTQLENPSFMISLNGKPSEENGNVIGGSIAYTGNFKMAFQIKQNNQLTLTAGINEIGSDYLLEKGEVFTTPSLILTYSTQGKGQVSRNIHNYARKYKLLSGDVERKILLNSWEGVYFTFTEEDIVQMINDIADIGGELFVLDDGWFANDKYERNNSKTGLGDWQTSTRKLPHGIDYLIDAAKKRNIDFGIWLEPEMVNTESELYNKHPDWIFQNSKREIDKGRGGTQVVLDLSNPKVQDFVFNIVNDIIVEHPQLDYIKWDANKDITNYGSNYLSKEKQSHIFIEYQKGLNNVLERLRKVHPDFTIQVCASGGGRVNYGFLPYFQEFWTSDNTDALKRVYMQWGISNFYPAIAMASHVSATKNHQTGRELPLKFRFDVAMSGRLGMELQPKNMTEEELAFSKKAIETYKTIRPIVQFGDLYRILSPYDNNHVASLSYVGKDKKDAVFYAFNLALNNTRISSHPPFKIKGLDPNKNYKLTEINKGKRAFFSGSDKVYSGKFLINTGIRLKFNREYSSAIIKLEQVD